MCGHVLGQLTRSFESVDAALNLALVRALISVGANMSLQIARTRACHSATRMIAGVRSFLCVRSDVMRQAARLCKSPTTAFKRTLVRALLGVGSDVGGQAARVRKCLWAEFALIELFLCVCARMRSQALGARKVG